jgi:DUF4097 and DUF4098 domain-containing protein YvlB
MLLVVGGLFLWRNLHPEAPVFDLVARYWPFLLIAWGVVRLIEALAWRREAWRASFTGGEVALVILVCIAGSGISAAHQHGMRFNVGSLDWWGQSYEYNISARSSAAGVKRIIFDNPRGNVRVSGADAEEVSISGQKTIRAFNKNDAERTNGLTPVDLVPEGDRISVRTNQDRAPENQRVSDDLEVTVPRGITVEARCRFGDYEISDISGDVEVTCDRGDVRLSRVAGNVRLEVGRSDVIHASDVKGGIVLQGRGSDVDLENITGQVTINGSYGGTLDFKNLAKPLQYDGRNTELRVQSVPGNISMSLSGFSAKDIVGPVRLVTRSRDIRLEQFTQSLDLDAQLGDIELQPGRVPLPSIEARSGSGSIELILPEKAPFQLQAVAERGDAVNDFGPEVHKEVEGRSAVLKAKVGEGPMIRLNAGRGSVSVRKQGSAPDRPERPDPPRAPKAPGEAGVEL